MILASNTMRPKQKEIVLNEQKALQCLCTLQNENKLDTDLSQRVSECLTNGTRSFLGYNALTPGNGHTLEEWYDEDTLNGCVASTCKLQENFFGAKFCRLTGISDGNISRLLSDYLSLVEPKQLLNAGLSENTVALALDHNLNTPVLLKQAQSVNKTSLNGYGALVRCLDKGYVNRRTQLFTGKVFICSLSRDACALSYRIDQGILRDKTLCAYRG